MRILFQGDSITDGNREKDENRAWDKNHQIGHSYLFIVTSYLTMTYPQKYEIINRAISGNKVNDLRDRWERDALNIDPDVLCVLVGVNDTLSAEEPYISDKDAEMYKSTYREILLKSREKNPDLKIILIEPFMYGRIQSSPIPLEIREAKFKHVREAVRSLACELDATLIETYDLFDKLRDKPNERYWLWDGVHPTEAGHGQLAKRLLERTKKILE